MHDQQAIGIDGFADARPTLPRTTEERSPHRLLVVDDEEDFVEMLSLRLEELGEKVTVAYSGQEGLDTLVNTPIDVVILDIKMPGMDGIEASKQIKNHMGLSKIPAIVFVSDIDFFQCMQIKISCLSEKVN